MAVRAADLAFVNLGFDTRPASASSGVVGDVGNLLADMVELKHNDVAFAAVDTWMLPQILNDLLTHLAASLVHLAYQPSLFPLVVLPIVPRVGLSKAVPTPRLQLRLATPDRWKRVERLHLATFRARSHEGERADRSLSRE
jgi:hypothetical protein